MAAALEYPNATWMISTQSAKQSRWPTYREASGAWIIKLDAAVPVCQGVPQRNMEMNTCITRALVGHGQSGVATKAVRYRQVRRAEDGSAGLRSPLRPLVRS